MEDSAQILVKIVPLHLKGFCYPHNDALPNYFPAFMISTLGISTDVYLFLNSLRVMVKKGETYV